MRSVVKNNAKSEKKNDKSTKENPKKNAQCCAKISKNVAGCHD